MAEHVIRLPDVGEGVAEAELVEWFVKTGDLVREDAPLAAVMTDKATVEIPSPVDGEVLWLGAEIGDKVAVGSDLIRLKIAADASGREQAPKATARAAAKAAPAPPAPAKPPPPLQPALGVPRPEGEKPLAAPAVRRRAKEAGIDLRQVRGTGPANRITHKDLDAFLAQGPSVARTPVLEPRTAVEDFKLVGLRRIIAERMAKTGRSSPSCHS